jgi:steroid 5-alpha reductase family enzyme
LYFSNLTNGIITITLFQTALWLISLRKKDASIVDSFWGLLFVLLAGTYMASSGIASARSVLVIVLVTVWASRLSLHIYARNHDKGEDYRYKEMRREHGPRKFWWYSYISVFLLQGGLAVLVSMPLLAIMSSPGDSLNILDLMGMGVWVFGFYFEAVSDHQLVMFKSNPDNKGKLLNSGLWTYTRHPNYFGDAVVWWSYFIFALAAGHWWSFLGSLVMSLFIFHVSGVKLLEKNLTNSKPGYEDYIRQTPAFVPNLNPMLRDFKIWLKSL